MSQEPSKSERRDAAREERLALEQSEAARAKRNRRLQILGGVAAGVIAVVVVIAVLTGGKESKNPPAEVAGVANTEAFVAGLQQEGNALGDPKAPITLVEYVDLQCPICKSYSQEVMPEIVERYVRTGQVRIEQQVVAILGPDSVKAQQFAATTVAQNLLWSFTHLFYENQGEENTGYVTAEFLNKIASATPGLDAAQARAAVGDAAAEKVVATADAAAVNATPTFKIGTTGGAMTEIDGSGGPQAVFDAIDAQLK